MIGFERKRSVQDTINSSLIGLSGELDQYQSNRLYEIKKAWNFYEGYHWEEMPEQDSPELTVNYCRAFVDKFVAFELGDAFTFIVPDSQKNGTKVTSDGRTLFEYLEDVWEDNNQYRFCVEMGQMKSITSEAWVQVIYQPPEEVHDPFGEYPDGRLRIQLHPTSILFPEFDPKDKDRLLKLTMMYQYEKIVTTPILGKSQKKQVLYKQIWTDDEVHVIDDGIEETYPNKYGVIPFVRIKNLPLAGRSECRGDLDDLIPLNTEYNMKKSNVSEIIDYHSAPITLVYGAKIGNLEKGANKVWGGLPKDGKVENLHMEGDLTASNNYITEMKFNMCEVGGIPEACLGGSQAISNTSGVALQYVNLPLIEKTKIKRQCTEDGLEMLHKLMILVSLSEGLIFKPESVPNREFFKTEVEIPNTLPKDTLLELQQIQIEMQLRLESRKGAMKRLGREDIENYLNAIDEDAKLHPEAYSGQNGMPMMNSGMSNGQTPNEELNKAVNGENVAE